jgi:hypothetical protein
LRGQHPFSAKFADGKSECLDEREVFSFREICGMKPRSRMKSGFAGGTEIGMAIKGKDF